MPLTPASRHLRRWACVLPLLVLVAGACSPGHYPQTTLRPLSDFARIGDDIQNNTLYWATGVFVLVEGALLYAIFRFRGRPDDPEPSQVHGNTVIEIIWTVVPALILAAIAVPTVRGIFQTNAIPTGDVLRVDVIGHQWWWEFRYPTLNLTTANELHIPVGQTVSLHLGSADVIHSFWPPRFAGKRDVFPNRETRLWFKAERAGEYPGQCAEFCGIQHGRMAFRVRAQSPAEFQTWVAHMQTLGVKPAPAVLCGPGQGLGPHGQRRRQGAERAADLGADRAAEHGAGCAPGSGLRGGREAVRGEGLRGLPLAHRGERSQGDGRAESGQRRGAHLHRRGHPQEHG
jgi:cytochrome c oxidase subunit 2